MSWTRSLPTMCAVMAAVLTACASGERRFPLREPLWRDADLQPVYARCHEEPTEKDPHHVSCAPKAYDAPLYWDGADNMVFRPLSETLGIVTSGEAVNVNSFDEVPDSSWFTNRLGVRPVSLDELRLNACDPKLLLDPEHDPDGSWIIDKGKENGSHPGFRIKVPGKGKYLVKLEIGWSEAERQVAASVIGEAVYYAAGYNATCEQALEARPSLFKLMPGLRSRHGNFGDEYDLDQKALDDLFAQANKHHGLVRMSASAWVPGYVLEQFRYQGTRSDDPNDVVRHENRRELRAARLIAAWIDDFDSREGNSLDTWFTDAPGGAPDASPGHVVHIQQGTSAALGSIWFGPLEQRMGYTYVFDWGDFGTDLATLGVAKHPWDTSMRTPGEDVFGYFNVRDFDPERWKNEYPNAAFSRMTERDGAWMARILAGFTPPMVRTLAEMSKFADPTTTNFVESMLEGRLHKILERYLTRVSPVAHLRVEAGTVLCGVDMAERRGLRDPDAFRYTARALGGGWLNVERRAGAQVCVQLPRLDLDESITDDAAERYVRVRIEDGVAAGPLVAHLYDLGPRRGYKLVGIERPDR